MLAYNTAGPPGNTWLCGNLPMSKATAQTTHGMLLLQPATAAQTHLWLGYAVLLLAGLPSQVGKQHLHKPVCQQGGAQSGRQSGGVRK